MPEVDWDITPGWGGTSRLPRVAGRRKAKEWNLIGALFDAATAERYDLVNRVCAPNVLDREVEALCEVMLAKNPITLRRTKFIMNKGADLHVSGALAFEVPIEPMASGFPTIGIRDFTTREGRDKRRKLSRNFWQRPGL
jgi:enoyl-CoA hydratase